jgi:putative glycosyltransferase (TIGR04372 family)
MIIDYALSGARSEFGDLYLGARCAFCLGTSTGFMAIPAAFKRPCAVVNFAPIEYLPTAYDHSLAIWKHHVKDGKRMSVAEIVESGAGQFMASKQFADAGIALVDNTPEEIRALALQMEYELKNRTSSIEQAEFWEKFPKSVSPYNSKPLHGKMVLRIGREFLKGYV